MSYKTVLTMLCNQARDVLDIRFQLRLAGYLAIFSNPVPAPVLAKMVPGTGYLSRIVLGPFPTARICGTGMHLQYYWSIAVSNSSATFSLSTITVF